MTNKEFIKSNWKELKGRIRHQWGDLTDDDMEKAKGNLDILVSKIEKKYGEKKNSVGEKMDRIITKARNQIDS